MTYLPARVHAKEGMWWKKRKTRWKGRWMLQVCIPGISAVVTMMSTSKHCLATASSLCLDELLGHLLSVTALAFSWLLQGPPLGARHPGTWNCSSAAAWKKRTRTNATLPPRGSLLKLTLMESVKQMKCVHSTERMWIQTKYHQTWLML